MMIIVCVCDHWSYVVSNYISINGVCFYYDFVVFIPMSRFQTFKYCDDHFERIRLMADGWVGAMIIANPCNTMRSKICTNWKKTISIRIMFLKPVSWCREYCEKWNCFVVIIVFYAFQKTGLRRQNSKWLEKLVRHKQQCTFIKWIEWKRMTEKMTRPNLECRSRRINLA